MSKRKDIHERVLNAGSKDELAAAYSDWADRYDTDLLDEMGYVAPFIASDTLLEAVPDTNARILDAGCGTGIVGRILHEHGYNQIDGLDYSQEMLDQAAEKTVYRSLTQADLTAALGIADGTYDGIISVGTFTLGHVGPEALDELVRVTKSGGSLCFTVRTEAWDEHDYGQKVKDLEDRGRIASATRKRVEYIKQDESTCEMCVFKVA